MLFAHITTRITDHPYDTLLREKGGRGFPTFAFLDAEGTVLGRHSGKRSIPLFRATAKTVRRTLALKDRIAEGERSLGSELFVLQVDLGLYGFPKAKAAAARLEFSASQQKRVDQQLIDLEVGYLFDQSRARKIDRTELARRLTAFYRADKQPSNAFRRRGVLMYVMQHAEHTGDPDLYAEAYGKVKTVIGDNPRYNRYYAKCDQTLARLRAAKESPGEDF